MRFELMFEVSEPGLPAAQFARLLLDLQEVAIMAHALGRLDELDVNDPALEPVAHKYEHMIAAQRGTWGEAEATVDTISQGSPLKIGLLLKVGQALRRPVAAALRLLVERVIYLDLERERRQIANDIRREDLIEKKLDNIERALKIQRRVRDPEIRRRLRFALDSTVRPFVVEHPPIVSARVQDDDDAE